MFSSSREHNISVTNPNPNSSSFINLNPNGKIPPPYRNRYVASTNDITHDKSVVSTNRLLENFSMYAIASFFLSL